MIALALFFFLGIVLLLAVGNAVIFIDNNDDDGTLDVGLLLAVDLAVTIVAGTVGCCYS